MLRVMTSVLACVIGWSAMAQEPPREGGGAPGAGAPREPQERRPDLMGRVTAVSADGRTLTIVQPPRPGADGQPPARDAKPEESTVTLTDATQVLFFGVADGQAQPAAGQMAMVWYAEGSTRAARVRLMKREGDERPDVQGRVAAVSPDGRTVTVETRDRVKVTGKADVRLMPYTQALYYNVERDGARPTVGYEVMAWLEKGSKDAAARVRFMKQ
jgi:hypothetical protein